MIAARGEGGLGQNSINRKSYANNNNNKNILKNKGIYIRLANPNVSQKVPNVCQKHKPALKNYKKCAQKLSKRQTCAQKPTNMCLKPIETR